MTDTLLLDTDVASFLFKRSPRADRFRPLVAGKRLVLSFMTVAELYRWTIVRNWGDRKTHQLEATLRRYVIVPYDRDLAWAWARIVAACERAGRRMPPSDAWIAATALRHDLPLVTSNIRDFEAAEQLCGVQLERPEE